MGIDALAIKDFLEQERDSHLWMKSLTRVELEAEITRLDPPPRFLRRPDDHQLVCFLLGIAYPQFFYLLEMGLGKTYISLMILDYLLWTGKIKKALILTPTDEVSDGWEEEIEKACPHLPFTLLKGSSDVKWFEMMHARKGLIIMTYPGLSWMVAQKKVHCATCKKRWVLKGVKECPRCGGPITLKGEKVKVKLRKSNDDIDAIAEQFDAVVSDESTKLGSHGSLWFKIVDRITDGTPFVYNLAGRGYGRDPVLLWSQFHLLDQGATFGPTVGLFKEAFYKKKRAFWHAGFDYTFDKKKLPDLNRIMRHRSIRYRTEECIDLPPEKDIEKRLRFPEETEVYYQKCVDEIRKAKGNYQESKAIFHRMRQISSGFIGFTDDETGEKAQVEFPTNPKMNYLMDWVTDLPEGRKFIIVHEYTWSGRRISEELTKKKIKHGWLWSGTTDWKAMKTAFDNDPNMGGLIINWKKGSMGLNLQAANYMFMFEAPVPCIEYDQIRRRIRRKGQGRTCYYYHPIVRDTVDEKIIAFHEEGRELWDSCDATTLLDGLKFRNSNKKC